MEKRMLTVLLAMLLLISLTPAGPASAAVTQLANGDVMAISLYPGEGEYYYIQVPSGATELKVQLYNMNGDLDLYTRYGDWPTPTQYHCRPYNDVATAESCYFENPPAGTWYFYVHGYTQGSAYLIVTYETASVPGELDNGEMVSVKLTTGQTSYHFIEVPDGANALKIDLGSMSGDLDLYTRYGAQPTPSAYHCRPYYGVAQSETCYFQNPPAGDWYIAVNGYNGGSAILRAAYTDAPAEAKALENNTTQSLSLSAGQSEYFTFEVPQDAISLSVTLNNMTGDLDLYTRQEDWPNANEHDCRPYLESSSPETCEHQNPAAGTWYILVNGYTAGTADITVNCVTGTGPRSESGELPPDSLVWSSWYWPWSDSINPNLFDDNEALHRYDLYTGFSGAQTWEYENHGPLQNPPSWWGSCHAWAGAACWQPQPAAAITIDGIQFRIRDQKGLITAAYFNSGFGERHEISVYRPSPGTFWKLLQDEIKGQDPMHGQPRAIIGELYYGEQIWNHPIYRYTVDYSGAETVSGTIQIWFAMDTAPYYADTTALNSRSLVYRFSQVRMNGTAPTDSGQWVDEGIDPTQKAPDAVWRPYRATSWATYTSNPQLDSTILQEILGPP